MRTLLFALIVTGCAAGSTPTSRVAQSPPQPGDNRWASRDECTQLVDHLTEIFEEDTTIPGTRKVTRRASKLDIDRAQVDKCTISLTRRDVRCLMAANDLETARQCERYQGTY